jgi:23S rRNA G2069 N7-methylase RlmK/C1962 C5-methylase RlmI
MRKRGRRFAFIFLEPPLFVRRLSMQIDGIGFAIHKDYIKERVLKLRRISTYRHASLLNFTL